MMSAVMTVIPFPVARRSTPPLRQGGRSASRSGLRFNGRLGPKLTYWNAVRLVNDAEDSCAEFLATGWSAGAGSGL